MHASAAGSPLERALADGEVLRRARAGDRPAMDRLLLRHRAWMRSVALRVCRRACDADDAVQEACVALQKLHQYRGDAPFQTWLFRVTYNAALMHLRRQQRQATLLGWGQVGADLVDGAPRPDERCSQRQQLAAVGAAVAGLSPALRLTLEMARLRGMETREVARALRITPEVVKMRVHRARRALIRALE